MRRTSILKWIAITAISLVSVFTMTTILYDDSAAAAILQNQTPTQGSLQALDRDGKAVGECPLKHTDVKAQVSGFLSRVTVTQEFENNFPNKIEAVYVFPLPNAAAVDDLTMVIGERVIKGKIMRREEAQAAYSEAKQLGRIASLLNQEQSNIFTQQVANILPGQSVRITISYTETLQYEDGSYEWVFPMVVAPRYVPAATDSSTTDQTANLSPPVVPEGVRPGHDISLELDLDAGVPLGAIQSQTHETEVEQISESHAVVRLKDRNTIPNKDFILNYRVAGDTINDAVLTHRSERGGFFTLILQPPQRVSVEDVTAKELVFVLDTSGSMSGFPIEKAKETMNLALSTLNPHDTFNLITFAGDSAMLFSRPVPATPRNLEDAKKFLASLEGNGGTEMMKAIKAALDPSDSQAHVRIACFLTDGQVSNEAEIIAEVRKHSNARVFAMGFGPAPNRALLDRMSQYGRGEVNYVPETGNTSAVARQFNDRVRSPLLTDITIEWGSLAVQDIYPARIPDLFSARPVVVSGRYTKPGKGSIWLKGKLAGQDFVREIPVEFPEEETDHDVLASLWARRRIEDIMADETANAAATKPEQDQIREMITQLGLEFKLMTPYTSFVAIDDVVFTGPEDPVRVAVPIQTQPGTIGGSVNYVTVVGTATATVAVSDSSQTNYATARSLQDLPLQGRSVLGLMTLTPGMTAGRSIEIFANGQRASSNQVTLDGVSADFGFMGGIAPSATGNAPALTASGGANAIASLDSTQEMRIQAAASQADQGRGSGAQVAIVTKSGTNEFHGSLFHFFGNDALDANDWFANSRGLAQPAKRLNSFGGTLGGPIRKDHTFFFASYEGMRLRQPMFGITDVPSLTSRSAAPLAMQPFLNSFPVANGPSRSDGFAEFASSFANPAGHDVGSVSIDHFVTNTTTVHGRYSFADSDATRRAPDGLSLNTTNHMHNRSQMLTGSLSNALSPNVVIDLRANFSRVRVNYSYALDEFGGAARPGVDFPASSFAFDLNSRNAGWMFGDEQMNLQRQFNVVGSVTIVHGNHSLRFGGDYRRLWPVIALRASEANAFFDGVDQTLTGVATRVNNLGFGVPRHPTFHTLGLFAQDDWRTTSRLTLTYGVRWELAPSPATDGEAFAVNQITNPTTLNVAAPGTQLWKTTFLNFAPRLGAAYQLVKTDPELYLRAGVGIVHDVGFDPAGEMFASSIPFVSGAAAFNSPLPLNLLSSTTQSKLPFMAFDPQLKVPYLINWNVTLQQYLGASQSISASYVGSSGNRLLHTETLLDQHPDFAFLRLITNRGDSDYRALQVQFDRPMRDGFAGSVSYTWARSIDNVTVDSARRVVMTSLDPAKDRGPSDFDTRHQLSGFLSVDLPALFSRGLGNTLSRNWSVDSIFSIRSARPLNIAYLIPTSFGIAYQRPDVVSGGSLFLFDPQVAGGRRLNPDAFVVPADLGQGGLSRNSLRGFKFSEVDLALRRQFHFTEAVALQIQADAFNVLNHANFEDPVANDLVIGSASRANPAFGQSTSMSGRGLSGGGFPSFYNLGGPRALRFSVKLRF